MINRGKHKKIANAFSELNSILDNKKDQYLEEISKIINKAIKKYDDKQLWKDSYEKIVDLFYAALTDTYLETMTTLRNTYVEISDEIPNIEDFIYKDDDITLSQRIKNYWDEIANFLKNPEVNTQEVSLYLLNMYNRILINEIINVKQGIKKIKKPILQENEVLCLSITQGSCEEGLCPGEELFGLEEELAGKEPPYHVQCDCDFWYDPYNTTDKDDIEELQEAGWEDEDG